MGTGSLIRGAARAATVGVMSSPAAAREIVLAALGHDPGPMAAVESDSHRVFVGTDVVVKVIDADRHSRLNREIALAPHLPAGLTAPLLASGSRQLGERYVRYACYARVPGITPGMGMHGVADTTARLLTEQAVRRLGELHAWTPAADAEPTLREPLDHGGFVTQAALRADIERLAALDLDGFIEPALLDGLAAIAERAPDNARRTVPVHADCHWGNWLASGETVTALLDFEWARFGEPADDWFFLVRFSGPHAAAVLDLIAKATTIDPDILRAQCEVRDAAHLASDLRIVLEGRRAPAGMAAARLRGLEELVSGHYWWRQTRPLPDNLTSCATRPSQNSSPSSLPAPPRPGAEPPPRCTPRRQRR